MPILNSLEQVWQNAIALIVLFAVFFWLYKNIKNEKFKESIRETIENFKENMGGEE